MGFADDYLNALLFEKKSKIFEKFKEFGVIATNECGNVIVTLRPADISEYMAREFHIYI